MTDMKHIDAVATWLVRDEVFMPPRSSRQVAKDILDSTDPAVHAAMLDALTRHGVLAEEEAWVPVAESGERWQRRDKDGARRSLTGWPAGGCYGSGDPWDGITHIEREHRYTTPWEVTP